MTPRPAPSSASPIVTVRSLVKTYGSGATAVRALDGIDLDIARGRLTATMGPSGSGKSTLMHCMAGLDKATSGTVRIDEDLISALPERRLTKLRRDRIGFIFQSFNLIPTLTALENITLPLDIARRAVDREHLDAVVQAVGLTDRLRHKPAELSGGQQQRVACARALVSKPAVIFADEPTGNLDSSSARDVLGFLRRSVEELGQSIVMVTHDPVSASYADRVLFLSDGQIVDDLPEPTTETVLAHLGTLSAEQDEEERCSA